MSEQQANQPINFSSFADWCLHKDSLCESAKHTVEMLLRYAGTSDIDEANRRLSTSDQLMSDLYDNEISDITPLESLTHLTCLYLEKNQISDITPLKSLTNLTYLHLSQNQISDITPLTSLNNLICLYLYNNQISDITPLQSLTKLDELSLTDNQISDLTPLQSLTNLRGLDLSNNQISDITPLQSLTKLDELNLPNNLISDLTPLLSLARLTKLRLSFTPEQKRLIKVSLHKWETLANSTKPIDSKKATAAVKSAYQSLDLPAPKIYFCNSPKAGLAQLQIMKKPPKCIKWFDRLDKRVSNALRPLALMTEFYEHFLMSVIGWEAQLFQKLKNFFYKNYGDYSRAKLTQKNLVDILTLIDFYVVLLGVVFRPRFLELVESMKQLLAECGWIFAFENICIVCSRPTKLLLDRESRLHAEGESAIEFADGYKIYSYHGITLLEKYGKIHPHSWQAKWILSENNAELKRVLIQGIGYDRICQQLQAVELDSWQEYTLLKIYEADVEPIYLLKMTCPSTGHVHALRVPPDVESAKEAIRWVNWDIEPEEFSVQS